MILRSLPAKPTNWAAPKLYALDTASLLLAGADPASIDPDQPETVNVSAAICAPEFHYSAKNWRSRLIRAAFAGEITVSIEGNPDTVGAWSVTDRWEPLPLSKAVQLVECWELRLRNIFFDVSKETLADWLLAQNINLPTWLVVTDTRAESLISKKSGGHKNQPDGFYIAAILLAWKQCAPKDATSLGEDVNSHGCKAPGYETLQRAVKAAKIGNEFSYPDKLHPQSRKPAQGLLAYACKCHGRGDDFDKRPFATLINLLTDNGITPLPTADQCKWLTEDKTPRG